MLSWPSLSDTRRQSAPRLANLRCPLGTCSSSVSVSDTPPCSVPQTCCWVSFVCAVTSRRQLVLRVVDCMLPAARSLTGRPLGEEVGLSGTIQEALAGAFAYDATFLASIRSKWSSVAMVQMRQKHGLLDATEMMQKASDDVKESRRADVAEHGLKHCALPSCGNQEAPVQQYKFCSACRSVWYCSAEHGALHWTEHKPVCRATVAARKAAAEGGAGSA